MSLSLITAETRLNSNTTNPTVDNSPVSVFEVNKVIVEVNKILAGTETITEVVVSNGTAAAPSMTFATDQTTGPYLIAAGNMGISAAGAKVLDISATGLAVTGIVTVSSTTDSTSKDTGAIITEGGIGVEKAIFAGTTINAGTAMTVGTSFTFAKEVNHVLSVADTTTSNTIGGRLTINAGAGLGTGNGGNASLTSGVGGATGAGGIATLSSGAGGATSGASGAVNITSGVATVGSTGTITISTGNTASGVAGDIQVTPGTHTSVTVSPVISLNKAVIRKPLSSTTASGGTITGVELVGGLIIATGATGNWQLPTAAQITTAIGSTPVGTTFDFCVNAVGMTATNTATLVVGANMTVSSAPAITGGGSLTLTQDTQVVGWWRITYDSATTCKIQRLS